MSVPPNHESNGHAECLNRKLLEKARCMLYQAGLPEAFGLWDEKAIDLRHLRALLG